MSQNTLHVLIDDDVRRSFDAFCSDVGITPSIAINMFVKAVLREKKIPFDITSSMSHDSFYNNKINRRLVEVID
ncbi:MAG: type II toxin-antitoxin system RelB/DinJ family antitoxin [Defluviitaleaceae bacterium]|nr:type II toxin-antitoxin system RelB/DinJ family antitoxin [Defluviitaleaceae bacterium]